MVVPSLNPPRASTRTRAAAAPAPSSSMPARLTRSTMRAKEAAAATMTPATSAGAVLTRTNTSSSSSLLAKGKEGFRKVSDKMKEKEKKEAAAAAKAKGVSAPEGYSESLQAFLRIRPSPPEADLTPAKPYLEIKNDKAVVMTAPPDNARHHIPKPPHTYSFDRVFGPDSHQHDFFTTTTLPLVDKLLKGDNGLMFAYGVSNSGKTYTIQGGNEQVIEERGVLPRAIDVVFNSIAGLESKANLKCQGLADVVLSDEPDMYLGSLGIEMEPSIQDTVTVDRNFAYAVFVSYAEVYNEKVFDLLESILPSARPAVGYMPRTMSMGVGLSSGIGSNMSLAAMANGGAGILKRRALVLKNDPEGTGKYISGLNEIRVRTREEALAVFRSGQRARQVFGTMANRESSRSHGIFTVKVVRIHNGAPDDPESAQVSRLAIVDLAGSERTRNTASTGDRLKEAGNINKSLMVLGQCIEVLRANQQKMHTPSSLGIKRRLAIVPFRHSKLTEIFQSFFVGDGRAVMIVHVNPYDTGFDENSNVMKFSSIAQEISTVQTPRTTFPTLKKQISSQFSALRNAVTGHSSGQRIKVMVPVIPKPVVTAVNVNVTATSSFSRPTAASASRASTTGRASAIPTASRISRPATRPTSPQDTAPSIDGVTIVEEEIEVVEEDAEEEEDDEHDYLVDYLFEELKQLKTRLYESEMRNAAVEMQIREEVSHDMQEAIQRMHLDFNRRLQHQTALGEEKADMKLDILQRTMAADEDTSFEHSFMTEGDESMSSATIDADASMLSDPFGPVRPLRAPAPEFSFTAASEEDQSMAETVGDSDSEEDAAEAEESMLEDSFSEANETRGEVVTILSDSESEDDEEADSDPDTSREEASRMDLAGGEAIDVDEANESGLAGTDEEDETGSESEEGSELDDDDDSGSDAEEDDEEDEAYSDGEASDDDISVSTASTSPRPRRTISPAKRGALPRTPTGRKPAAAHAKPQAASASKPKASKPKAAKPLRDSNVQPLNLVSDDDDVVKKDTPVKKKRALGKKIITEDEIEAANEKALAGGAEVRRLVRG